MKAWSVGVAAIAAGAIWMDRRGINDEAKAKPTASIDGWTFPNSVKVHRLGLGEQCAPSDMRVTIGTAVLEGVVPSESVKVKESRICVDLSHTRLEQNKE